MRLSSSLLAFAIFHGVFARDLEESSDCELETSYIYEDLLSQEDYINLRSDIQLSGYFDTNKDTFMVMGVDKNLEDQFQNICEASGGQMVKADVFYETIQSTETCISSSINYDDYPICLSNLCVDGSQTASQTAIDYLFEGLGGETLSQCSPEIDLEYVPLLPPDVSYNMTSVPAQTPPDITTYYGNENNDEDDNENNDEDGNGVDHEDDHEDGHEVDYEDDTYLSSCYKGMTDIFNETSGLYGSFFEDMAEFTVDLNSNTSEIRYNGNTAALQAYSTQCSSYNGRVIIGNVINECPLYYERSPDDNITDFEEFPFCVSEECTDEEAEEIMEDALTSDTNTCETDFFILGTLDVSSSINNTKRGKKKAKVSKSMYGTKTAKYGTKVGKKSNLGYGAHEDRSDALQCVADMTEIHGDNIGVNPTESRSFQIENMVDCDGIEETSEFTNPACTYNGNVDALETFTNDCEYKGGRVVVTDWLFTDECITEEDDSFAFWYDWVGFHDCVSTSCGDEEALDFFHSIYFDPRLTSCYADVSIVDGGANMAKTAKVAKTSKGTKGKRSKVVKKVVSKAKKSKYGDIVV